MKTVSTITVQINHTNPSNAGKVNEAIISGILSHLDASGIAHPAQIYITAKTQDEAETLPAYKRINNDINGNPRYVVHYLAFLGEDERGYDLAHTRAKKLGGKKYRGKDFAGGFVFQSYNINETLRQIVAMRQ
jgi:hypothetical protein